PSATIPELSFGTSSNGRTADSGSAYRGSNPCVPVQNKTKDLYEKTILETTGRFVRCAPECAPFLHRAGFLGLTGVFLGAQSVNREVSRLRGDILEKTRIEPA